MCVGEWQADFTKLLFLQIGRANMYEDHQKLKTFSRDIAGLEVSQIE